MKHKVLLFSTLSLLSLSLAGCGQEVNNEVKEGKVDYQEEKKVEHQEEKKEKTLDATKYTETPQNLQKVFNQTFKGYQLSEISIDVKKDDVVYQLEGINKTENMEATLKVKATKTSEVTMSQSETMDSEDQLENTTLNLKTIKISPKKAMELAKEMGHFNSNPNEWQLENNKDNIPVYKVSFEKEHKEIIINAENGKKISAHYD